MKELKGAVFVIISAIIFGCMPIGAKYIYGEGCNSSSLVVYRYCLCLPVLLLMALWEQREAAKSSKVKLSRMAKKALRLSAIQFRQFAVLSLGFALTPILLFSSYNYISSGSATSIHFSYPVFVILASVLIFKEKLTKTKAFALLFCLIGLTLFYNPGERGGVKGIVLALLSGLTYTFYMIYYDRSILKFIRPFKTNFYLSLYCTVVALFYALISGSFVLIDTAKGWGSAFGFSFMLSVVACMLFQMGITLIGAQKTAILSTFEPITSVVLGTVLFHEKVGIKTGLGVLFILAAVLSITFFGRRRQS